MGKGCKGVFLTCNRRPLDACNEFINILDRVCSGRAFYSIEYNSMRLAMIAVIAVLFPLLPNGLRMITIINTTHELHS